MGPDRLAFQLIWIHIALKYDGILRFSVVEVETTSVSLEFGKAHFFLEPGSCLTPFFASEHILGSGRGLSISNDWPYFVMISD